MRTPEAFLARPGFAHACVKGSSCAQLAQDPFTWLSALLRLLQGTDNFEVVTNNAIAARPGLGMMDALQRRVMETKTNNETGDEHDVMLMAGPWIVRDVIVNTCARLQPCTTAGAPGQSDIGVQDACISICFEVAAVHVCLQRAAVQREPRINCAGCMLRTGDSCQRPRACIWLTTRTAYSGACRCTIWASSRLLAGGHMPSATKR